jgi:hypothetical protein
MSATHIPPHQEVVNEAECATGGDRRKVQDASMVSGRLFNGTAVDVQLERMEFHKFHEP